ncbi:MAG: hypothetical protein GY869_11300 [Planctomycetes bacterium]|nr:hypothetical protein [Planctomycetota bacterium]
MKPNGIPRRKFLKTSAGVALAGAVPIQSLFAASDQTVGSGATCSDETLTELHRIALKYGGEFGQIKPETKEG